MTNPSTPPALATALAYHQAWTSHNLDEAMTYIADDITCDAPGARISETQQYRDFLGRFMVELTGVQTVAVFGDDTTAEPDQPRLRAVMKVPLDPAQPCSLRVDGSPPGTGPAHAPARRSRSRDPNCLSVWHRAIREVRSARGEGH